MAEILTFPAEEDADVKRKLVQAIVRLGVAEVTARQIVTRNEEQIAALERKLRALGPVNLDGLRPPRDDEEAAYAEALGQRAVASAVDMMRLIVRRALLQAELRALGFPVEIKLAIDEAPPEIGV